MSNYNQTLQTNNSSLEEIITQLNNMPDAGGGLDTSDATATSGDILSGKTAYVKGEKIEGAIPTVEVATPVIAFNKSNGEISALITQYAGYTSGGIKMAKENLAFQSATTITPGAIDQIAVPSDTFVGGDVTVKGDANLVASNIVSGKSIFGVVGTATAGGGGDTSQEDRLVNGTLTNYTNDRVTTIRSYAFANCYSLTSVSFPVCTTIGSSAFAYCSNLTSVSFPVCTTIGVSAFDNCSRLTSVSFPVCTTISSYAFKSCSKLVDVSIPECITIDRFAFNNCTSLSNVNFPMCTSIGANAFCNTKLINANFPMCTSTSQYAFSACLSLNSVSFPKLASIGDYLFSQCHNLTSMSFPICTDIGNGVFYQCSKLTTISFPECVNIGEGAFKACTGLTQVNFPKCISIRNSVFESCTNLTSVSFQVLTKISSYVFKNCSRLVSIYLGTSTVCSLVNSNAFSNTSIWSTKGSIFVPASLVDAYKTASHWSYFSNRIFSYNFT